MFQDIVKNSVFTKVTFYLKTLTTLHFSHLMLITVDHFYSFYVIILLNKKIILCFVVYQFKNEVKYKIYKYYDSDLWLKRRGVHTAAIFDSIIV